MLTSNPTSPQACGHRFIAAAGLLAGLCGLHGWALAADPSSPTPVGNASAHASAAAPASNAPAAGTTVAAVAAFTERFKARNPGTRVDAVAASAVPGLYEVAMGRNLAYVDASGRYALFGHVWDLHEQRDLTADRLADRLAVIDRVDVATLPLRLAIRRELAALGSQARGAGASGPARVLHVFADPQCGYCRQLEHSLTGLDKVTVYTWVLPILGEPSQRLAAALLCAKDPAAAWHDWMLEGRAPVAGTGAGTGAGTTVTPCAAAVTTTAGVEQLARRLGITGTPTLITGDGRRRDGAMDTAALIAWLDAEPKTAAGTAGTSSAASAAQTSRAAPH